MWWVCIAVALYPPYVLGRVVDAMTGRESKDNPVWVMDSK
jgi:hypothetical protein